MYWKRSSKVVQPVRAGPACRPCVSLSWPHERRTTTKHAGETLGWFRGAVLKPQVETEAEASQSLRFLLLEAATEGKEDPVGFLALDAGPFSLVADD